MESTATVVKNKQWLQTIDLKLPPEVTVKKRCSFKWNTMYDWGKYNNHMQWGPKKKIKIELPVIDRAKLVTAGEVTLIERLSKLQVVRRKTQWWALPLRPVNNEENVVVKMLA